MNMFYMVFLLIGIVITYLLATKGTITESGSDGCFDAILFWMLLLLLVSPIGEFSRGDLSPLPWVAFQVSFENSGLLNAFYAAIRVFFVDIWLLWIPGHTLIKQLFEAEDLAFFSKIILSEEMDDKENEEINFHKVIQRFRPEINRRYRSTIIAIRVMNIMSGLLLMTEGNPVYRLLKSI